MKVLNSIKILSLLTITLLIASCSDDDNSGNQIESSTILYASNNSNGNITYYDVTDLSNISTTTLITTSTAADGVYYEGALDAVIQASRSGLGLEGFTNISNAISGAAINADLIGTTDMSSPREVAVDGTFYVVADNQDVDGNPSTLDGRLFVYIRNGNNFSLRNVITTDFKLWGITFINNDLYAVVDADNELAVFTNFLSNTTNTTLSASKRVVVEGIVRTHGIALDGNTMVLTDIGVASGTGTSATDGAFHIISDFSSKFNNTANGGTLALSEQVRVEGSSTLLGNPVDVAYDATTNTVFIAEAANGKILAFNNIGSGGNLSPVIDYNLASASAVYLSK